MQAITWTSTYRYTTLKQTSLLHLPSGMYKYFHILTHKYVSFWLSQNSTNFYGSILRISSGIALGGRVGSTLSSMFPMTWDRMWMTGATHTTKFNFLGLWRWQPIAYSRFYLFNVRWWPCLACVVPTRSRRVDHGLTGMACMTNV